MEKFSTYSLTLLLIVTFAFILSFTKITKTKYLFIFFITLLLSLLASFFDPIKALNKGNYTDLYRFYQTLDLIKGLPFNNEVVIFQEYNNIFVMKIVLFLISRIGINSLLPFISSFIFYGVCGIFIIKVCEKYNISSKIIGVSFFVFISLSNFTMVISNIRCPIGNSIFILTLFYDLLKKEKSNLFFIGYIICCGIHPIFILFTALRLLLIITNKFSNKILYIIILIYNLFIPHFLKFIENFTNIELFDYLSTKIDFYVREWETNSNETVILILAVFKIFVVIYYICISKNKIKSKTCEEKIYRFTILFTIFTISSYWNFVLFQRCTQLLIFFIVYWYMFLKSSVIQKSKSTILLYDAVMLILVIISLMSYFLTYQYGILTF